MKTIVHLRNTFNRLMLAIVCLISGVTASAQTYTTIANGDWKSAATWQGGLIPNALNITASSVVNIRHIVTFPDTVINNYGTFNIKNPTGLAPRFILANKAVFTNNVGGKVYINNAEYRQSRFVGGMQSGGTPQTGSFLNKGGFVEVLNSYVEVAQNWSNTNWGTRFVKNSSVTVGNDYIQNSNGTDTLTFSSVSVGWHGAGDFNINGSSVYYQSVRIQIASAAGNFKMNGCIANGSIDYITFRNHVTNTVGTGDLTASMSVGTSGLNLSAYCVAAPANYKTNGKVSGDQTSDCSLTSTYFPATLFASITPGTLNFSLTPVLIAGVDKQVGAQYRYQGVAPGIDAIVKVDSLVNGATITSIDDNTPGQGFLEGFQPQITSGSAIGSSYAKFSFVTKITATDVNHNLAKFTLTGLDIDGTATLKEFQEIGMGPGAVGSYILSNPQTLISQVLPGTFRAINISGVTVNGVDTTTLGHMFTVSNNNISSFTLTTGISKTTTGNQLRLFSLYFKGFVYPNITTLPVKMESFTATLNKNNKVDLKWTTASEINTSHFVVERSINGTDFSDVGIAFAYGDLSTKTNYSMVDDINGLKSTIVYYKIRSVDNDNKTQYSETRIIRIGSQVDNKLTIMTYPNPVTNELRITVPDSWQNKQVQYELVSGNGTIVNKTTVANSSQTETMNISNLAPGFYILRAVCNGVMAQQKIIKH